MIVDLHTEYQNLNSGNLRMNGLNSSFDLVGSWGPSESKANKKFHVISALMRQGKQRCSKTDVYIVSVITIKVHGRVIFWREKCYK
jgi:hypothetical protein